MNTSLIYAKNGSKKEKVKHDRFHKKKNLGMINFISQVFCKIIHRLLFFNSGKS